MGLWRVPSPRLPEGAQRTTLFRIGIGLLFLGAMLTMSAGCADEDADAEGRAASERGAVPALSGVEIQVVNGVAPYDHESSADSVLLRRRVVHEGDRTMLECVNARGFDVPIPDLRLPEREPLRHGAAAEFPFIEALARDGLKAADGADEPTDPDAARPVPPSGVEPAVERCMEQDPSPFRVEELWSSVRGSWCDVLGAVEALPEVAELREEFSDCLSEQGVPPSAAQDEMRFLMHVDTLSADADEQRRLTVAEEYGQLYVDCGRGLFEARERLRGGERRADFLAEHADAIRELDELLFGDANG